jgi:T5SS/PEP-CTERM-associated repeat protein
MFSHLSFLSRVTAKFVALSFVTPSFLAAQTSISQGDIGSLYDSGLALYALSDGVPYVNSGNLNFGTASSGNDFAVGVTTVDNVLTISEGTVTDYKGIIGYNNGSGTVNVTGASAAWANSDWFYVGHSGTGTLNITGGAAVTNTFGYICFNPGRTGTVTVSGAGSRWLNSAELNVAAYGTGTLNIQDGGAVSNTNSYVAGSSSSRGTVTVSGADSRWTTTGTLYAGFNGTASIDVLNGGTFSSGAAHLGRYANSHGTVTVNGSSSTWTSSGVVYVGNRGYGTLNIQAGGRVSNTDGYIGYYTGASGTVTVTGAGSTWTNSGNLELGTDGTGTLNIEDGGAVTSVNFKLSHSGTGTVNVRGLGSSLTCTGDMIVGYGYTGILNIEDGAVVNSLHGYIAYAASSAIGTATVTGSGSLWSCETGINVGYFGAGTLTIADGALVTGSTVYVGRVGASAIYLDSGYLALEGSGSEDKNTLEELLDRGTAVYAWNGTQYVAITSSDSALISCVYYEDITTCDALDAYGLFGSYTVLTSTVPEPATYALFGGLGALGLAVCRRRRK